METQELISLLRTDVREWNEWRLSKEDEAMNLLQASRIGRHVLWNEEFKKVIKMDLTGANLAGLDLRGAMLGASHRLLCALEQLGQDTGGYSELQWFMVSLEGANLSNADLRHADLNMALLAGSNLHETDLREADLRRAILNGAKLEKTDLRGANLSEACLDQTRIIHANFDDADLSGATFHNARLFGLPAWLVGRDKRADGSLRGISKAHFARAKLNQTDFSGADLSGLDFQGIDFSKTASLSGARFEKANLCKADLRSTNLTNANLTQADLAGADLRGARLTASKLQKANMRGAKLSGVDLSWMDLTDTNLAEADLANANLAGINLTKKDLRRTRLDSADLSYTILVETDFTEANLEGCRVYGVSAWDVKLATANQKNLVITPPHESTVTVDDLELAQFIYLLRHNERVRHVIDTITSKVVLILGRFTEQRKPVLDAIRNELRRHDYVPVLFDFDRPATKDTHETVTTLARMARFVIADITDPKSIPQELVSIVEQLPSLPIQPILHKAGEPWAMYDHLRHYPWVLKICRYGTAEDLIPRLREVVILPVEAKLREIRGRS